MFKSVRSLFPHYILMVESQMVSSAIE